MLAVLGTALERDEVHLVDGARAEAIVRREITMASEAFCRQV